MAGSGAGESRSRAGDGARYQILGELGRGGLGLVLRGRDGDLRRGVAVKVLRTEFADRKDLVERFLLEAQLGGQLQHPGIAPVYDLGITRDGRPFFTMKLVQGSTLAELLAEREDRAGGSVYLLGIFSQICKAVGYAHARGVVHRDLKPVNVMVGEFGEVQVVDWGLAKVTGGPEERASDAAIRAPDLSAAPESRSGTAVGTPGYMAPEQARAEVVGPASDVYSLGVILFEILAGRQLPECAAGAGIDADQVRGLLDGQDQELQRLALECLAPEPAGRPHDALEVSRRIDAHMTRREERAHEAEIRAASEEARADEAQGRLQAESRARRLTVVAAAVVVVALAAGGGTWAVSSQQSSRRELAASLEIEAALGRATAKQAEALALEQAGAWTEALEAARGALAIAKVQPVNPVLEARAQSLVGELEDQLRMTLERDRRRELAAAFEQDLRALREQASRDSPPSVHFEALQASFTAYGHSLEDGLTLEHKRRLEADGLCELAIQVLDTLGIDAQTRHKQLASPHRAETKGVSAVDLDFADGWATFWNYAQLLDGDPERRELRELAIAGDAAAVWARVETLIESDTTVASTLALAAGVLGNSVMRDEAVRVWRHAVRIWPDQLWARHGLGTALFRSGKNHEEAIAQFEAATALAPESSTAWSDLGAALATAGRTQEALHNSRRAVRLEPEVGLFHSNLELNLYSLGRFEEAVEAIDDWLEIQPNNGFALERRAKDRVQLVDPAGLRSDLEALRRLHTEDETSGIDRPTSLNGDEAWMLTEGNLWEVLCEPDLARDAFEAALDLRPDYPEALLNLGRLLQSDFQEYELGLDLRRGGHELGSQQATWEWPSGAWVEISERKAEMARLFAEQGAGVDLPPNPGDGGLLAQVAYGAGDMETCVWLLSSLELAGEPGWEFQDGTGNHTWLMWAKALVKRAQDPQVPVAERAELLREAADRLQRELAGLRVSTEAVDRRYVRVIRRMVEPGLASVRGEAALSMLDAETAEAWRAYWSQLEDYRQELRGSPK